MIKNKDIRVPLPPNTATTLLYENGISVNFTILSEVGRGGSCIVYKAECEVASGNTFPCVLKEFYPVDTLKYYDIVRKGETLVIGEASKKMDFDSKMKIFKAGAEAHKELYKTEQLRNYSTFSFGLYEGNGTAYCCMLPDVGESYDKFLDRETETIEDTLKTILSFAKTIKPLHDKGYLHLDIKPQNLFILKETRELIKLFDFDSIVSKEEAQRGEIFLSGSPGYAAIELRANKYKDIDETTDIFSLGAIFFRVIFGRYVSEMDINRPPEIDFIGNANENLFANASPRLFPMLSVFLRKTCLCTRVRRYKSIDEVINALEEMLRVAHVEFPLSSNPPLPINSFQGRIKEIEDARKQIVENGSRTIFLQGQGGIGKTELAIKCAENLKKYGYQSHFVVYQDNMKNTITQNLYFTNYSNIDPYGKVKNADVVYKEKMDLLAPYNEKTILIIDNFDADSFKNGDEASSVSDLVNEPAFNELKNSGVTLIFTTRNRFNVADSIEIPINELSEDELFELFCTFYTNARQNEETVREIIKALDHHTFVVELAAKTLEEADGLSSKEMLEMLKNDGFENDFFDEVTSTKQRAIGINENNAILYEHIQKLYNISTLTDEEKVILGNASLLSIAGMNRTLFLKLNGEDTKNTKTVLTQLIRKGWIKEQKNEDNTTISMHAMPGRFISQMLFQKDNVDASQFVHNVQSSLSLDNVKNSNELSQVIETAVRITEKVQLVDEKKATIYNNIGYAYGELGIYQYCINYSLNALEIRLNVLPDNHPDIVNSFINLGTAYTSIGNCNYGLECFNKALEIQKKTGYQNDNIIATIYNNIGYLCGILGKYKDQLSWHQTAVLMQEKIFPENHPDIATSYNNIGMAYQGLGDYINQLTYCEKALELRKEIFQENHHSVATSYNNVGIAYGNLNDYKKQLEYCLKAKEIQEQLLPENHPDIATTYNNIGLAYEELENYQQSLKYYHKALEKHKEVFHENHPSVATSYNNVGIAYGNLNDYKKQLEYCLKAKEIQEQLLPENHPDVAMTYNNIGLAYGNSNDYENALEYCLKAKEILDHVFPENHPFFQKIYETLSDIYQELGDFQKSIEYKLKKIEANFAMISKLDETYDNILKDI